jgi:hypothetical protein
MSVFSNLRQKDDHTKRKIVMTISISCAALLLIAWVLTTAIGSRSGRDTSIFTIIGNGLQNTKAFFHK